MLYAWSFTEKAASGQLLASVSRNPEGRQASQCSVPTICATPCLTLLPSVGVHAELVQETLGHSSYQMTMDAYSHAVHALRNEVIDSWCPEGDLNPHDRFGSADFKPGMSIRYRQALSYPTLFSGNSVACPPPLPRGIPSYMALFTALPRKQPPPKPLKFAGTAMRGIEPG
jgi:hypothetical protein